MDSEEKSGVRKKKGQLSLPSFWTLHIYMLYIGYAGENFVDGRGPVSGGAPLDLGLLVL